MNNPPLPSSSGVVAKQSLHLGARTTAFLASGVGFLESPLPLVPSVSQGRPVSVVPSFVPTFSLPCSTIGTLATTDSVLAPIIMPVSNGFTISNVARSPFFKQPCRCSWFFHDASQNGKPNSSSRKKVSGVKQVAFHQHRSEQARLACAIGWALRFHPH